MDRLWRHIRVALRVLGRNRTFTFVTLATLALGIGATTAIFSVIDATLLREGPYDDSHLVLITGVAAGSGVPAPLSFPNFEYLQQRSHSFSDMAAFSDETFTLTGRGQPEQLDAARVSWNFFRVLDARPALGRSFLPEEDRPGGKDVVLISHALWTNRFGASRSVIGQSITLDSRSYTIVGVLPPDFAFPFLAPHINVWASRLFDINVGTPAWVAGGAGFLSVAARLRPSTSLEQAQSEVSQLYASYRLENPARPDSSPQNRFQVADFRERATFNFRPALFALFGAVSGLLLIACGNIASIMLARALARRQEMAIRVALGASRLGVIAPILTESLLLALGGGLLGLLLAYSATPGLASLLTKISLTSVPTHIDVRLLLFVLVISLLSGILFGIVPALQLSRRVFNAHKMGIRGGTVERDATRGSRLLVIFQVTLSVTLVISATLLIRSFLELRSVPLGFDPMGVVTMRVTLSPAKYSTPEQMRVFYDKTLQALQAIPDVDHVSVSSALPLTPARLSPMLLEGQPAQQLSERPILNLQMVSPDYPAVFHIPVLRGRMFTEHDDPHSQRVALVNERLARTYWPGEDPAGKRIWIGRMTTPTVVVGVLADTRNTSLAEPSQPEVFVPFSQLPWGFLNVSVHARHASLDIAPIALRRLAMVDKDQPVTDVRTASELINSAVTRPRATMLIVAGFSSIALIFAIVGIYGVLAYSVEQRTREMGIRMALGASRGDVLRQVQSEGVRLTAIGLLFGLVVSVTVTRFLASLLYATGTHDLRSYALAVFLFLTVGTLASSIPARRATKVDPASALRAE